MKGNKKKLTAKTYERRCIVSLLLTSFNFFNVYELVVWMMVRSCFCLVGENIPQIIQRRAKRVLRRHMGGTKDMLQS